MKKMADDDNCCIFIIVLAIIGAIVTYWYIALPIFLIVCVFYLLTKKKKNTPKPEIIKKSPKKLLSDIDYKYTYEREEEEERQSRRIPAKVQREVWRRDEGRCVECKTKEKLEYDHIIPFSRGGSNTARNIQLLCESCNRKKSNNI